MRNYYGKKNFRAYKWHGKIIPDEIHVGRKKKIVNTWKNTSIEENDENMQAA